ncbi:unnamed protein product [marine sediment metagenome]|uniref:Peptidase C51 domain-containing protein n=1 Tax=marine sediment metagenome TaxID=412755 RepID=X1D368_9ZZZZ
MTLLETALHEFGVTEIKGRKDNLRIVQYFTECGWDGSRLKDETAWCSVALNWCAMRAGLIRSESLTARSWLKVGISVKYPLIGDVVVFWRMSKADWRGHVGIYICETANHIYCLGANQGIPGQWNIKAYPRDSVFFGLLGYRMLYRVP